MFCDNCLILSLIAIVIFACNSQPFPMKNNTSDWNCGSNWEVYLISYTDTDICLINFLFEDYEELMKIDDCTDDMLYGCQNVECDDTSADSRSSDAEVVLSSWTSSTQRTSSTTQIPTSNAIENHTSSNLLLLYDFSTTATGQLHTARVSEEAISTPEMQSRDASTIRQTTSDLLTTTSKPSNDTIITERVLLTSEISNIDSILSNKTSDTLHQSDSSTTTAEQWRSTHVTERALLTEETKTIDDSITHGRTNPSLQQSKSWASSSEQSKSTNIAETATSDMHNIESTTSNNLFEYDHPDRLNPIRIANEMSTSEKELVDISTTNKPLQANTYMTTSEQLNNKKNDDILHAIIVLTSSIGAFVLLLGLLKIMFKHYKSAEYNLATEEMRFQAIRR